jgi:hypothetical protein
LTDHAAARVVPLGLDPSFGFGDRLGLATPGHLLALGRAGGGIRPIFAQQSIREMTRTGRSPQQVMDDALRGAADGGYRGPQGADADHLKTPADVDRTAEAGFCFFTIDPSEHVDAKTDDYTEAELWATYRSVALDVSWIERYRGQQLDLGDGERLTIGDREVMAAAVKYGRAVNEAVKLARHIDATNRRLGRPYEIELSVDETPQPTTLAEHYIVADRCLSEGVKLVSLAPRYVGDFEKGVDFKGDPSAGSGQAIDGFEHSLRGHAAIAEALGPYKLSLHSGSDKLSIYPAFARATKGRFHVKTAGTSYLEALRVVARHDAALFRRIVEFARSRYETDKATYHVSATLAGTPAPSALPDARALERTYLELWSDVPPGRGFTAPGRQILHTTFGSVLTHAELGPAVKQVVVTNRGTYDEVLADHFARHLEALRAGM